MKVSLRPTFSTIRKNLSADNGRLQFRPQALGLSSIRPASGSASFWLPFVESAFIHSYLSDLSAVGRAIFSDCAGLLTLLVIYFCGRWLSHFHLISSFHFADRFKVKSLAVNNLWHVEHLDHSSPAIVSNPFRVLLLIAMLGLIIIPSPKYSRANSQVLLIVDAKSDRHPISPYIYGLNEALPRTLHDLNIKLNRWGGNRATTYNWKEDTTSTAADWYFQNLKSGRDRAPEDWKYKDYELFIRGNKEAGTESLITIPMIGWVAKDSESKSFSVAKYGPQHSVAPEDKDAGDGFKPDNTPVANDPGDASLPADIAFQRDWIRQIVKSYGPASAGGIRFYSLDNEPSLWHEIHRDLHPKPVGYDEIFSL